MAVAIADGATTLSDVRVLGDQPGLFGEVASVPTMWRTLEATDAQRPRAHRGCSGQRSSALLGGRDGPGLLRDRHRRHVGQCPLGERGCGAELQARLRLRANGRLPRRHGRGPGRHLAPGQRGGRIGAKIMCVLLDAALAQLPVDPLASEVIARTDSAGASHGFVDACATAASASSWVTASAPSWLAWSSTTSQKRWVSTISADGTDERDAGVGGRDHRPGGSRDCGPRAPAWSCDAKSPTQAPS